MCGTKKSPKPHVWFSKCFKIIDRYTVQTDRYITVLSVIVRSTCARAVSKND